MTLETSFTECAFFSRAERMMGKSMSESEVVEECVFGSSLITQKKAMGSRVVVREVYAQMACSLSHWPWSHIKSKVCVGRAFLNSSAG